MHYEIDEALRRPVFSAIVTTPHGVEITNASSRDTGCTPEKLRGKGYVDLTFDSFPLLPGSYQLTVALTDHSRIHDYDVRRDIVTFEVDPGTHRESSGLVALGGQWELTEQEA